MKKITFFNFKKLVMTVVAFMGCVSLSYAQGDWTLVSEEDLTSEVEKEMSELLSSLPENYYANIPGSGSYGELKYTTNCYENGVYPLYLISNGSRGDFFCIKSTLEPGEYRFTFRAKYPSTKNVGNLGFFYSKGDPASAEKVFVGENVELTNSYADYTYVFTADESANYNMGFAANVPVSGWAYYAFTSFKLEKNNAPVEPEPVVEASYDDFGKPTAGTTGNKRAQTKGEVLNGVGLLAESPLTFTPTGTNANQAWANSDNPILANPGATFDLKVTYSDAWGSLTVFQLRSDVTPSAADKIFGTYEGSWYGGVPGTGELYTNINNDSQSGATASATDKTATFPITIPSDLSVGEMVVIRFIICKTAEGATFDGDPCTTTATELNYCDYVVKIAEEGAATQYGAVTVDVPADKGSVEIQALNEGDNTWSEVADLTQVAYGTQLRAVVTAAEGYAVSSVTKNGEALTANEDDNYYYFTVEEESVAIAVTFQVVSGIDEVEATAVYYAAGVLYAEGAHSVKVYDLSGRVVMSAADVDAVSVSSLAGGVYMAVVDGKVVKFVK